MRSRCSAKDVYFMAEFFQVQLSGFTLISVYGMISLQIFSFIRSWFFSFFFFRNSISFSLRHYFLSSFIKYTNKRNEGGKLRFHVPSNLHTQSVRIHFNEAVASEHA